MKSWNPALASVGVGAGAGAGATSAGAGAGASAGAGAGASAKAGADVSVNAGADAGAGAGANTGGWKLAVEGAPAVDIPPKAGGWKLAVEGAPAVDVPPKAGGWKLAVEGAPAVDVPPKVNGFPPAPNEPAVKGAGAMPGADGPGADAGGAAKTAGDAAFADGVVPADGASVVLLATGVATASVAAGAARSLTRGTSSAIRMKAYAPGPDVGAFLWITVHPSRLPCDVRAQMTGDGGNFSSPAISVSRSVFVRSRARPVINCSSLTSPSSLSNQGTAGGPSSSSRTHRCHFWSLPALREPRLQTASESDVHTMDMRHAGRQAV